MTGLVIFLTITLGVLLLASIILIVMIVQLTVHISRAQKNTKQIHDRVDQTMSAVSIVSSAVALIGALVGKSRGANQRKKGPKDD